LQGLGHAALVLTPASQDFLCKLVAGESVAEDQARLAHNQLEKVELLLEKLEQVFLQRAGLNEVVNAHRMLLAEAMEAANALLDLHRVPRQIEVHEPVAKTAGCALRCRCG